MKLNNYFGLPV